MTLNPVVAISVSDKGATRVTDTMFISVKGKAAFQFQSQTTLTVKQEKTMQISLRACRTGLKKVNTKNLSIITYNCWDILMLNVCGGSQLSRSFLLF